MKQTDGEIYNILGWEKIDIIKQIYYLKLVVTNRSQIQCNSYQITNRILHKIKANSLQVCNLFGNKKDPGEPKYS